MAQTIQDLQRKPYLKGLGLNILTEPVIYDTKVINRSIFNIVTTGYYARIFNVYFGSTGNEIIFENVSSVRDRDDILDRLIQDIYRYEKRIEIDRAASGIEFDIGTHVANISITYIVKNSVLKGTFKIGVQI